VFEKLVSQTGKAPGPDGWPAEIFKQCADHFCPSLFNKSLDSSVLPSDWKIGHIQVTPIFKKGNKTKVNNYHPVCLTSIIIKVFEKRVSS